MYVNIINSYRNIVAIADKELVGKKFEENNSQIDVKESFYKGELKTPEEVITIMQNFSKEDATFNLIGEKTIKTALEAGIITEDAVGKVEGIKFAIVLL
ncbi:DUF424 family protein [archaeon]|jgi:hypothetical protein|nr:DUF424 family protein [archaeon]